MFPGLQSCRHRRAGMWAVCPAVTTLSGSPAPCDSQMHHGQMCAHPPSSSWAHWALSWVSRPHVPSPKAPALSTDWGSEVVGGVSSLTRGSRQSGFHCSFLWEIRGSWELGWTAGQSGAGRETGMQEHSSSGSHDGLYSAGGDPQIFVWLHSSGMWKLEPRNTLFILFPEMLPELWPLALPLVLGRFLICSPLFHFTCFCRLC